MSFLEFDFMQRALVAGTLVGLAGPAVGVYIVQRRLALMGDGIGHVAFAGVAAGLVIGASPVVLALIFAVAGALVIEALRRRRPASGDVALALIFYAGIAGGVLLLGLGDTSTISVNAYLFGSVLTVGGEDLRLITGVAAGAVVTSLALRKHLFAVSYDEEVARVSGLPVNSLNALIAVLAAVTIAVAAKVVGILLVSSMLVLPVATVQQLTKSFRATVYASLLLGVGTAVGGLVVAFYADLFPAATIVLSSIAFFVVAALLARYRVK